MTCIAGLVCDGHVYIAGDSAGLYGSFNLRLRADEKVFRNGPFLFGFCQSFRMGQLLHHAFVPPAHPKKMADDKFMSTTFIDAVRDCLANGGHATKQNNEERFNGAFLVGYRGRLYEVGADFQVGQFHDEMAAIGCGDQAALGSLFTSRGKSPEERLQLALSAAERFSSGVRAPFTTVRL